MLLSCGYLGCPRSQLPARRVACIASNHYLRSLSLEASYIGDKAAAALVQLLPYLYDLNLRCGSCLAP